MCDFLSPFAYGLDRRSSRLFAMNLSQSSCLQALSLQGLWAQIHCIRRCRVKINESQGRSRLELSIRVLPSALLRDRLDGIPVFGNFSRLDSEQIVKCSWFPT